MTLSIHRLSFDIKLKDNLNSSFRGAVIKAMGAEAHPLMHNHIEDGLRFAYPLVQYKIIDEHPTIISIGDIGDEIRHTISQQDPFLLTIQGKKRRCNVLENDVQEYIPMIGDNPIYYSITSYIPLTGDNVCEYDSLMALTDKICMLEKILTGNILSFFKGIGYCADRQILCVITSIDKQYQVDYKKVRFRAFDMHFVSNVELPNYIGLGKSTSVGMGIIQSHPLPEPFIQFEKT